MRILAIDTALGACSAAISLDGETVGYVHEARARGHAESLFAIIAEVERQAGLSAKQMDRFAVTIGPGTFTGLRVGLSAARGLGLAAKKPVLGFTTFLTVAAGLERGSLSPQDVIATAFDAKRGECYLQVFDTQLAPLTAPQILHLDAAALTLEATSQKAAQSKASCRVHLLGTGSHLMAERLGCDVARGEAPDQPDARSLTRLASAVADPQVALAEPLYLRAPDAKLPKRKSLLK